MWPFKKRVESLPEVDLGTLVAKLLKAQARRCYSAETAVALGGGWDEPGREHKKLQSNQVLVDVGRRTRLVEIVSAERSRVHSLAQRDSTNNVSKSREDAESYGGESLKRARQIAFQQLTRAVPFDAFYGCDPVDPKSLISKIDAAVEALPTGSQFFSGPAGQGHGSFSSVAAPLNSEQSTQLTLQLVAVLCLPDDLFRAAVRRADPGGGLSAAEREKRLASLDAAILEAEKTINSVPPLEQCEIFGSFLWLRFMNFAASSPCDAFGCMLEDDAHIDALRSMGISWACASGRLIRPTSKPRGAA